MANPEHLKILAEGVEAWNKWKLESTDVCSEVNLSGADLSNANLSGADLKSVNLHDSDLSYADISNSELGEADLRGAIFVESDLTGSKSRGANLSGSIFSDADFRGADFSGANFGGADLTGADLTDAELCGANFHNTELTRADLSGARFHSTLIVDTNLSETKGLEYAKHFGPSSIGIDTLYRSGGKIPEIFLRGAGVPDVFIKYASSLTGGPFEFYSCFISYSSVDEEFATRLHNDFQGKGIRCWKWDHDARTGRSLWGEIDGAIKVHNKLVLIASESSLKSPAVNREIERALVQEDERLKQKGAGNPTMDHDVLFPVRLDDFVFKGWEHERKVDVTKKVIADARGWDSNPEVYARVRDKLVRDLKNEKPKVGAKWA